MATRTPAVVASPRYSPDDTAILGVRPLSQIAPWLRPNTSTTVPPFSVKLPDGTIECTGNVTYSQFTVHLANAPGREAFASGSELALASAYLRGDINITGDMLAALSLRGALRHRPTIETVTRHLLPLVMGTARADRKAIQVHYEHDDDFYLTFLDPTRTYSQGVFASDADSLEEAMRRKLDFVIDSCHLRPGSRVLDVGGGWGAFTEYAGSRGIHVTSLTISNQSQSFLTRLIADKSLPCQVVKTHFLDYTDKEPFQAIVILGVLEHMPYYRHVLRQCMRLLQPQGYVYIDGSATKFTNPFNPFMTRFIYPGNHRPIVLDKLLREVRTSPLSLSTVLNDTHSYFLTTRHWATRLESSEAFIVSNWGEALYRSFRLYLWGVCHNFLTDQLQAYRLLLRTPSVQSSDLIP
jgi:cyclopropane-fatty-acyl-phospholipid synthase